MWIVEVLEGQEWKPAEGIPPQESEELGRRQAVEAFGTKWWAQFFTGNRTLRVREVPS